jgi:type I restriction enzyme S subunit
MMSAWATKRIDEIADVVAGGTPSTSVSEYWDGDIAWITPNDLSNHQDRFIVHGERNISELGLQKSAAKIVPQNTVLLTTRAPIGYLAIAQSSVSTNQGFKNLICKDEELNYEFLYYYIKLNVEYFKAFASGATFPELSGSALKKIKVTIPDLATQTRIADILSAYDDAIENNNRRIVLLEKAAQELYKEWFVRFRFPGHGNAKFINGLPEGWEVVSFGTLADIIDGDRGVNYPKQDEFYSDGYCLFLNAGNVTKNGFAFSNNAYITDEKDKALRKGKLSRNDIVLTTRGTVGNVAFYDKNVPCDVVRINSGMVILRDSGNVPSAFLYITLSGDYAQSMMTLYASGSAQPQLPIKDMRKMKILKPADDSLAQFAGVVDGVLSEVALLQAKSQNLAQQRDMFLPRLMSGKLEV